MSQTFARIVFALTAAFFAAFFIWPIFQILKGGFIDADGKLTFEYLGLLLSDPTYLGGLGNAFLLACATTTLSRPPRHVRTAPRPRSTGSSVASAPANRSRQ